jgi:hypothetical protein
LDCSTGQKAVYIGYGEAEDPLPELPQVTRYRIFAGPCRKCGCDGRKILPSAEVLVILCDQCRDEFLTTIPSGDFAEVTYIYWCNSSRFDSDAVELSPEDRAAIDELEKCLTISEIPRWAVAVVGGRCTSSDVCVNFSCQYCKKSQ